MNNECALIFHIIEMHSLHLYMQNANLFFDWSNYTSLSLYHRGILFNRCRFRDFNETAILQVLFNPAITNYPIIVHEANLRSRESRSRGRRECRFEFPIESSRDNSFRSPLSREGGVPDRGMLRRRAN